MAIEFPNVLTSRAGQRPLTFPASEIHKIVRGWNSRLDLREIEDLANRIAETPQGQLEPVLIRKGDGGKPELVAGNRRVAAISHINSHLDTYQLRYPHITGPMSLRALVIDCTPKQAKKINLAENLDKLSLSPMDKAHTVQSLANEGWEDKEIAEALRCSTTYLPTLRGYLALPEEAQRELHDGVLTGDLAKSLTGLPEREVREVVKRVKSGATTPSEAKREVNESKRKKGEKITRSLKEVLDELDTLDELDLAFDLANWVRGESTYESLRELIELYNVQVHAAAAGGKEGGVR